MELLKVDINNNFRVGIIADNFLVPFFLPERLTQAVYRHFLEEHDGTPAYFSLIVREYSDITEYPNPWIGRGSTQPWHPRSPDLNSADFFLWGNLKQLVYTTQIQNVEEPRNRIVAGCETIRNTPGIFERVRQSMVRRVGACIEVGGQHFQQLL